MMRVSIIPTCEGLVEDVVLTTKKTHGVPIDRFASGIDRSVRLGAPFRHCRLLSRRRRRRTGDTSEMMESGEGGRRALIARELASVAFLGMNKVVYTVVNYSYDQARVARKGGSEAFRQREAAAIFDGIARSQRMASTVSISKKFKFHTYC